MAEQKPQPAKKEDRPAPSFWESATSVVSGTDPNIGKCSDDEILKAAPKRTEARNFVLAFADPINKNVKPWMVENKIPEKVQAEVVGYFEKELKWWDNTKLCEIDIKTRITSFKEKVDPFFKDSAEKVWPTLETLPSEERTKAINSLPLRIWREIFEEKNKGIKDKEVKVEKEKKKKIQSKTFGDNVKDGIKIAMAYVIPIIWILLALRFGGFAMSDLLYKPIPYRLLAWLYTFIFMPVFIPYYGYKELRYQLDPLLKRLGIVSEDAELPRFESMFPIFPYKGDEEITLQYKLFGYPSTKENEAWVTAKQEEENTNRLDFVSGTQAFLDKIIKAKEESMKEK